MKAEPEKFRLESVTGVERRVAWNERNGETLVNEGTPGGGREKRADDSRGRGWKRAKGVGEGMSQSWSDGRVLI